MEAKAPDKSLYNNWEVSGEIGNALFNEALDALQPIMDRHVAKGYRIREIAHQMVSAVTMLEAETCIRRNSQMYKQGDRPTPIEEKVR